MAVKLQQHHSFLSSSCSKPCVPGNLDQNRVFTCKGDAARIDYVLTACDVSRKICLNAHHRLCNRLVLFRRGGLAYVRTRRSRRFLPVASADDNVAVNGSPSSEVRDDVEEMRVKINQSLQGEDQGDGLVHSIHDAARVFELAIEERGSLSKLSWFSMAWFGVDRNAWVKTLSYQASVHSLLQAACEISSRDEGRDKDVNIFVQRSLLRLSAPLESLIRDKLSAKQPEANEWFWSEQVPAMVTSFVDYFEGDPSFGAATTALGKVGSLGSSKGSDVSLLLLALTCIAALIKLGPAKLSCPQFFSTISDVTNRLMDMLVDFISIRQAYYLIKSVGLRNEFLVHFGPRAASYKDDYATEEIGFWVSLIQKQLQRAIDRERIWSRLTTSESIEVLERDLAIFGFFIALGRATQSFFIANGFDVMDDPVEGLIRYLIGGSVLYYPQLSSISSYQLYVEVVCEELDWLPFYPGSAGTPKQSHAHGNKSRGPPNAEAIGEALDVCSYWMQSFIKHSKWLESPSNVKAAKFLSKGYSKVTECMEELGLSRKTTSSRSEISTDRTGPPSYSSGDKETDSFNKALESVEEALMRLENLLQELHVSSSNSGREQLKAACSDLEKIRKLKKEAEFLEASFRAKAASLRQEDEESSSRSSPSEQKQVSKGKKRESSSAQDRNSKIQGAWSFFARSPIKKHATASPTADESVHKQTAENSSSIDNAEPESNEIRRFELLRNELKDLEKRVQRSTDQYDNVEDFVATDDGANYHNDDKTQLIQAQKKENILGKSIDKLKETSTNVLQGTQLLAIDVAAATELLRRALIGDELTVKEQKALRRTMTDLASVVPIGVLMLLPVTAVGHAAMLAAIQRYVPALIPSTYGAERLDLLRQLEKIKELEASEMDASENGEELA